MKVDCHMSSICIFSALCLPNMGGVERFTDSLSAELVAEGHRVVVVTNNTHGLAEHEVLESGVEMIRLPCWSLLGGRYPVPIFNKRYRELMSLLDSVDFSGVLINTRFYVHSLVAVRFAKRRGIKAAVLDHGSAYLTLGSSLVDLLIERYEDAITAYIKKQQVEFYGISFKSVEWLGHFNISANGVISNSIDAQGFREQRSNRSFRSELAIRKDDLLIAFVGRLIPEKGIETLLCAIECVSKLPVKFVVAGDGPLRKTVEESNLDNLHYVGRLCRSDIASLLVEADVFCLPTRSEGFCTSLLEASACKTPSIVTDVGGASELIPTEQYGFILNDPSAESLEKTIVVAFEKRDQLAEMGERCRDLVEREYSWRSVAASVLQAIG